MLTVQKALRYSTIALMGLGVGCSGGGTELSSGNTALGIAKFEIADTANKTSVVGLDEQGQEVGRLDLVHGRFTLSGQFKEDYPGTPEVDGRKLDVSIGGKPQLIWETAGYEPTLHMPAHPASLSTLAAFLADPHVRPVLEHWQIGFDPMEAADGELAYTSGEELGSSPFDCSTPATTCGTARTFTISTCGGGAAANVAKRSSRTSPYTEYVLAQCCPISSGITAPWFAIKTCPTTGSGAQPSSCGTTGATAACKSCSAYPTDSTGYCGIETNPSTIFYCYDPNSNSNPTLSVALAGLGQGTVTGGPGLKFKVGINCSNVPAGGTDCQETNACSGIGVKLTATPLTIGGGTYTYSFDGWSGGGCSGTNTTCVTTMASSMTVTANFGCHGVTCP